MGRTRVRDRGEVTMAQTPRKKKSWMERGCLSLVVLIVVLIVVVVIVSVNTVGGGGYTAPGSFTVSDSAVASLVSGAINKTSGSPGLHGSPQVNCTGEASCNVTYTVKDFAPFADLELIAPTRQIWKALFEDSNFQHGTITVKGPPMPGVSRISALFTLSCDRNAASRINWDNVNGDHLRRRCSFTPS